MSLQFAANISPMVVNVQKKETPKDFQLIYASQLYGTFFAVGAKLVIKNEHLIGFELCLINYKGLYNLGMASLTKVSFSKDLATAELTLHLSAFSGTHGHGNSLKINFDPVALASLKKMTVSRKIHSFNNHNNITSHLQDHCFDSEFYERDGAAIRPRNILDDALDQDPNGNSTDKVSPDGVCRTTKVNFTN